MPLWLSDRNTCTSFFTWQCHEVHLELKDPYHVVHYDNHTFNQKISNHIFKSSSGGLVNH